MVCDIIIISILNTAFTFISTLTNFQNYSSQFEEMNIKINHLQKTIKNLEKIIIDYNPEYEEENKNIEILVDHNIQMKEL